MMRAGNETEIFHLRVRMKNTFIAIAMLVTNTACAALDSRHAEINTTAAQAAYNHAAFQLGSGVNGSEAEQRLNAAAAARAQAYADERAAAQLTARAMNAVGKGAVINATSMKLAAAMQQQRVMGVINVAAGSLPGTTPVSAAVNGVQVQTTAAALPPGTQVAVPHIPAITMPVNTAHNGGQHHQPGHETASSTRNNGAANAHAGAMGGGMNADGHGHH
ncbi:hypothetical protein [Chimaeribacter arupi]|uniref:hypothetical protein n=1 Tax=Chimaeribacter arupi TaxID=2060066 RepID=UPI0011AF167B|nr:hypothetical protein [Chimaeribacter arupi]